MERLFSAAKTEGCGSSVRIIGAQITALLITPYVQQVFGVFDRP